MPLAAGARLGPYEIVSAIGAGGMGEVYRARDSRLGRDVAIKVLAASGSSHDRLARFEQEARAAAALSHPNILAVHDIGLDPPYIVSELLDGVTLRERMNGSILTPRKAIEYAVQITRGLAAAHARNIVHRDLKPDNVFVTTSGQVKILDFGLAKLTEAVPAPHSGSLPPTTPPDTVPGMVLGTVGYMSPEQVRGQPADHRSDIFAFGAVLYEMLSGRRAFSKDTSAETMTAILKEDPPDLQTSDRHLPPALARIVDRCLEKDPGARFQSAGDLGFALDALSSHSESGVAATLPDARRRRPWMTLGAAGVAVASLLVAGWTLTRSARPQAPALVQTEVSLVAPLRINNELSSVALSADGSLIAYLSQGTGPLMVRPLSEREGKAIPGTEGATSPFFSPDGEWLAFFARGELKKVSLAGAGVATIASVSTGTNRGADWFDDGTIVFTPDTLSPLLRVSSAGGVPESLTTLDASKREASHRWPDVLPGGKAIVYTVKIDDLQSFDDAQIVVRSLETGEVRPLVQGAFARYVPTGHLVYARAGSLFAVPFDIDRLSVGGVPVKVLDGVITHPESGAAQFAVSPTGTLVYGPGDSHSAERSLVLVNRAGNALPLFERRQQFSEPRLSPDGRRLAVVIAAASNRVWISELARGTLTRVLYGLNHQSPVWSPDGARVAFASQGSTLAVEPADGSGPGMAVFEGEGDLSPTAWSPDGRLLLFDRAGATTGRDLWVTDEAEPRPRIFLQTPANERSAALSSDGRWVAYVSDESGRSEIYVRPFPGPGGKWQISTGGGTGPMWSRDGKELFFANGNTLMSVPISSGGSFEAGVATKVLSGQYDFGGSPTRNYDVTPDGREFVTVQSGPDTAPVRLNVILNWLETLRSK